METVKKRKVQNFGHVLRAGNLRTHILEGNVNGRKSEGRQMKKCDSIEEEMSQTLTQPRNYGAYGDHDRNTTSW